MDDREELRRRLRDKIRGKRSDGGKGPQLAQRLRDDPTTAMLQMGLDDAGMLNNAKGIVKNPHQFLRTATTAASTLAASGAENAPVALKTHVPVPKPLAQKDNDDDEEEAPPPS